MKITTLRRYSLWLFLANIEHLWVKRRWHCYPPRGLKWWLRGTRCHDIQPAVRPVENNGSSIPACCIYAVTGLWLGWSVWATYGWQRSVIGGLLPLYRRKKRHLYSWTTRRRGTGWQRVLESTNISKNEVCSFSIVSVGAHCCTPVTFPSDTLPPLSLLQLELRSILLNGFWPLIKT